MIHPTQINLFLNNILFSLQYCLETITLDAVSSSMSLILKDIGVKRKSMLSWVCGVNKYPRSVHWNAFNFT